MANKTCKNCIYMQQASGDFVCANADSEYLADFIDLKHTCDEHRSKKEDDEE